MPTDITRTELIELLDTDGVQLVDVLPSAEYAEGHIPGAINIPLRDLDAETVEVLNRDKPVAVY